MGGWISGPHDGDHGGGSALRSGGWRERPGGLVLGGAAAALRWQLVWRRARQAVTERETAHSTAESLTEAAVSVTIPLVTREIGWLEGPVTVGPPSLVPICANTLTDSVGLRAGSDLPDHWPNTGPNIAHGVEPTKRRARYSPCPRSPRRDHQTEPKAATSLSSHLLFRPSATAASNDDHGEDGRFLCPPRSPPPPPPPRRRRVGLPRHRCRGWVGAPLPLPPLVSSMIRSAGCFADSSPDLTLVSGGSRSGEGYTIAGRIKIDGK
jgi:hypothetical protein